MGEYIALAASLGGAVLSAVGESQQSQAAAASAKYQAKVAENNRILAERAAQDAVERGRVAENAQRLANKRLAARQQVALAGNNVDVTTGGALSLAGDTAAFGELDALTVRSNAEREALGFKSQGMNFQAQSDLLRAQSTPSYLGAAGTFLGGVGTVASKWYDYQLLAAKTPTSGYALPSGGR